MASDLERGLNLVTVARTMGRAGLNPSAQMAEAAAIADAHGFRMKDFERAADMIAMTASEYFRHEKAVAAILHAANAPVRARLVQMANEPADHSLDR